MQVPKGIMRRCLDKLLLAVAFTYSRHKRGRARVKDSNTDRATRPRQRQRQPGAHSPNPAINSLTNSSLDQTMKHIHPIQERDRPRRGRTSKALAFSASTSRSKRHLHVTQRKEKLYIRRKRPFLPCPSLSAIVAHRLFLLYVAASLYLSLARVVEEAELKES